jgi:CSLREA domain-containing protein
MQWRHARGEVALRVRALTIAILAMVTLLSIPVMPALSASVFVVNSTGDSPDINVGDGICDDGGDAPTVPAACTLRAAIEEANATSEADTIAFNIPGAGVHTISPASALPAITDSVTIDATTQGGYAGKPVIRLDGTSTIGISAEGLNLIAGRSTIWGLAITNFDGSGIRIVSSDNILKGNFIGVEASGLVSAGNSYGVDITGPSVRNIIGGTAPGDGNVIAGNYSDGVLLWQADVNVFQGNFIGVGSDGVTPFTQPNGLVIHHSVGNLIGGTGAGAGNVIAGHEGVGVLINGERATGNTIQGNYIGTDQSGTLDVGNKRDGIHITTRASNNLVGGLEAGAGNLISGNDGAGVVISEGGAGNVIQGNLIGTDKTGSVDLGNAAGVVISEAPDNVIGGMTSGARNVISGNGVLTTGIGVVIGGEFATRNILQGNYIGTNATGTAAIYNGSGIEIIGASANTIGGASPAARNVISGNNGQGVRIFASSSNTLQGNYIGVDVTGSRSLGNTSWGVWLDNGSSFNSIGGVAAGAGNVISGGAGGIYIYGGTAPTSQNYIQGNYIGTNATGDARIGNGFGISIGYSSGNLIGGTEPGARNVISGNHGFGVAIIGDTAVANRIHGNYVGTDATGGVAIPSFGDGVAIYGASRTEVGGRHPAAGNVIAGVQGYGVIILNSSLTSVYGNRIGTSADGAKALGTAESAIAIQGSSATNAIGGTLPGMANVIANSAKNGVLVEGTDEFTTPQTNPIRGNSIHSNFLLGINNVTSHSLPCRLLSCRPALRPARHAPTARSTSTRTRTTKGEPIREALSLMEAVTGASQARCQDLT